MRVALVCLAIVVAFFVGLGIGAQPRTCGTIRTSYGDVPACTNDPDVASRVLR